MAVGEPAIERACALRSVTAPIGTIAFRNRMDDVNHLLGQRSFGDDVCKKVRARPPQCNFFLVWKPTREKYACTLIFFAKGQQAQAGFNSSAFVRLHRPESEVHHSRATRSVSASKTKREGPSLLHPSEGDARFGGAARPLHFNVRGPDLDSFTGFHT